MCKICRVEHILSVCLCVRQNVLVEGVDSHESVFVRDCLSLQTVGMGQVKTVRREAG